MKKIMIVEDELVIREELIKMLNNNGYETNYIKNFKNTLEEILNYKADLILLDINIPYLNGEIILQNLRKKSDVPVIMLTSKISEVDEVLSMSYGADDYITKPYNPTILLLKISAILKRTSKIPEHLNYNDIEVLSNRSILRKKGKEIELTKNEMIIFNFLLNMQGKIVSREELMTALWNNSEYVNENTLTVNISRLRNKLAELGCKESIETKKGQGYILIWK